MDAKKALAHYLSEDQEARRQSHEIAKHGDERGNARVGSLGYGSSPAARDGCDNEPIEDECREEGCFEEGCGEENRHGKEGRCKENLLSGIERLDGGFLQNSQQHSAGCLRPLPIPAGWQVRAGFSRCGQYRYSLCQRWGRGGSVLWCMMNPSAADLMVTDATVAKCARLAARWGYGGQLIANACAYRATNRLRLLSVPDPCGSRNRASWIRLAEKAALIVVAHGRLPGQLQVHAETMCRTLRSRGHSLHVLKLLEDGTPSHPLARGKGFIPETTVPIPW